MSRAVQGLWSCQVLFSRRLCRPARTSSFISGHKLMSASGSKLMLSSTWTSKPQVFPTSGFDLINPSSKIEEETLPTYSPEKYYPVRQGEIFDNRYQALSKLGYGVTSTAWFARDLVDSTYVVLKIYTLGQAKEHELNIYKRINSIQTENPGRKFIRKMFGYFVVNGPNGQHICLVHEPLGTNTTELLRRIPGRVMTLEDMKPAIHQLLGIVDFLHSVAHIVHTDIQLKNLLLPSPSSHALSEFVQREIDRPARRKVLKERTIYTSSQFPSGNGLPRLSDFGEARLDQDGLSGDIMPDYYRTPEVILKGNWNRTVDIWSVAMVAWDIVCPYTIIKGEVRDGIFDDGLHIAELVTLLGQPPPSFLAKKHMGWVFWDETGKWKDLVSIPDRSLEKLAANIQGEDVKGFLRWLRRALQWNPQDRPTAMEFATDPWLMKGLNKKKDAD